MLQVTIDLKYCHLTDGKINYFSVKKILGKKKKPIKSIYQGHLCRFHMYNNPVQTLDIESMFSSCN